MRDERDALRHELEAQKSEDSITLTREEHDRLRQELATARAQLSGREVGEIGNLRREMERLRAVEDAYNSMEDPEPLHSEIDRLTAELRAARVAKLEAEKAARQADDKPYEEELARLRTELAEVRAAQTAPAPAAANAPAPEDETERAAMQAEIKRLKAELNRQIQINQSMGQRHKVDQSLVQRKKKKGGK